MEDYIYLCSESRNTHMPIDPMRNRIKWKKDRKKSKKKKYYDSDSIEKRKIASF